MSSYSFQSSCSSGNDNFDEIFFDISDYLTLNDLAQEEPPPLLPPHQGRLPVIVAGDSTGAGEAAGGTRLLDGNDRAGRDSVERITASCVEVRFAFRTKTDLEMLDDGYKWRKYGKKKVKNSPNPRNYYRCSSVGCKVKKRVERSSEDSNYLLTTYDGIHNHHAPSLAGIDAPRLT
ncbi:hypothetical protein Taro_026884 [Colocasia esculenta]|uniref:WRKY domain-containing protein n=1 Tax=Colocasia esculenta TaxID=4460 RepID=A0A843V7A3_COLES|nr:hypothetical protein [Colocasia esculenta]